MQTKIIEGQGENIVETNIRVSITSPQPDKVETVTLGSLDNLIVMKKKSLADLQADIELLTKKRELIAETIKNS